MRLDKLWPVLGLVACTGGSSVCTGCADTGGADEWVDLPGGEAGIALDDLRYSATLGKLVVAAGRTGKVDLVDPDTLEVTEISGFTTFDDYNGSDQQGVESADEGSGLVYAVDRAAFTLSVIDPEQGEIIATTELEHTEPDYVRVAVSTGELWISNYGAGRLEVLDAPGADAPVHDAFVELADGPEGLTVDEARGQVYTRYFGGDVAVIDLVTHELLAEWPTGCSSAHGIAVLDDAGGRLFVGCGSAEAVVLDLENDGAILDDYPFGPGSTIMTYSESLHHLYLRGDGYPEVAILGVSSAGSLTLLGSVQASDKGHCMQADASDHLWVCDWTHGRLLQFTDDFPASG